MTYLYHNISCCLQLLRALQMVIKCSNPATKIFISEIKDIIHIVKHFGFTIIILVQQFNYNSLLIFNSYWVSQYHFWLQEPSYTFSISFEWMEANCIPFGLKGNFSLRIPCCLSGPPNLNESLIWLIFKLVQTHQI